MHRKKAMTAKPRRIPKTHVSKSSLYEKDLAMAAIAPPRTVRTPNGSPRHTREYR